MSAGGNPQVEDGNGVGGGAGAEADGIVLGSGASDGHWFIVPGFHRPS
jgi:hypothetical protein